MQHSPGSALLLSGVSPSPPPPGPWLEVRHPEASLNGSLRVTLSREPKCTWPAERALRSGDASDSPGRSSALVGVTVKRTDAMATRSGVKDAGGGGSSGGGLLQRGFRDRVEGLGLGAQAKLRH